MLAAAAAVARMVSCRRLELSRRWQLNQVNNILLRHHQHLEADEAGNR